MMWVGIDVSKDWFDAFWQEPGQEHHQRVEYTSDKISFFMKQFDASAHFVMEATGVYHSRLALQLYEAGFSVSVVNPLVIKRFSQMQLSRAKSDAQDARLICAYAQTNEPAVWQPKSEAAHELQQLHSWLNDLLEERTRLVNRMHAYDYQVRASNYVKRDMQRQLKRLNSSIDACEKQLEDCTKKSFSDVYHRLMTIPSIGTKTAVELIIITDGFTRFSDAKALCAYVGVSPSTYQSGSSVRGKGGIRKMGNGRMRQLLYLCSWTAKRCNPACAAFYQVLAAQGKPKKFINIAIAHKLLRQAFAVATKNCNYSAEFA